MSDFGAMVLVRRQDGQRQTAEDFARLDEAIRAVQAAGGYRDALAEPFRFRVTDQPEWVSDEITVLFSEYWGEGIDEGEYGDRTTQEILDADRPAAQAAHDALGAALGPEYTTELICDTW